MAVKGQVTVPVLARVNRARYGYITEPIRAVPNHAEYRAPCERSISVIEKVFCKIFKNRLVQCLDKEGMGQAGFRLNRGCMDNVYTLNEIVQGRLREDKKTYAFFLDIQKVYDAVWRDVLLYKLLDMGVKWRMWRVIKKMYESSIEGEKSDSFNVEQGVSQRCSLSPILFSVFINDLLNEVEQVELGIV